MSNDNFDRQIAIWEKEILTRTSCGCPCGYIPAMVNMKTHRISCTVWGYMVEKSGLTDNEFRKKLSYEKRRKSCIADGFSSCGKIKAQCSAMKKRKKQREKEIQTADIIIPIILGGFTQ